MYNVRLFDYPNGAQLRIYKSLVVTPEKVQEKKEFFVAKNPWGHEYVLVERMKDEKEKHEHCVHSSLSRTINTIYSYSRSNTWDWFVTLTFNPELVNSFDYSECTKKLSVWLSNLRRDCPDMKYLIVPEKHKSARYHFHGLFANCDNIKMVDSGKRTSKGQVIYNIGKYRLGFSTATAVSDNSRVTKYICKYVTKELAESTFNKRRYWCSKNLHQVESQDMIMTQEEIEGLKSKLAAEILHSKSMGGQFQTVTYVELSSDIDYYKLLYERKNEND